MKFVKAADKDDGARFVDLDKVEAVSCKVEESGGGVDVLAISDRGHHKHNPKVKTAVITLHMAGGDDEVRFENFIEAQDWLHENFVITVSFAQL
jgi:hypothetical protein